MWSPRNNNWPCGPRGTLSLTCLIYVIRTIFLSQETEEHSNRSPNSPLKKTLQDQKQPDKPIVKTTRICNFIPLFSFLKAYAFIPILVICFFRFVSFLFHCTSSSKLPLISSWCFSRAVSVWILKNNVRLSLTRHHGNVAVANSTPQRPQKVLDKVNRLVKARYTIEI